MSTAFSKHGVECVVSSSGNCFGNRPLLVPVCCLNCGHYDDGEYGDYGSLLSGPYCEKNLLFPVKRGQCKRHTQPDKQFRSYAEWEAYEEREWQERRGYL